MIERIRTVGFKGFNLDESIPEKVIYTGKNKSGKSARAGAIAIALYGYIPFSTAGKRPGDILASFGSGSLVAAVTIGGKEFGRKFSRNAKGVVSQVMQVDGKRMSSENFAILLNKAGDPRIANVAEFMKQSEAKKIDTLFDLFPNPALASIDIEIEKAKADVSRLEKKKSGAEAVAVRLNASKVAIDIPASSIAETQAEIKAVEIQIVELEAQVKQAEIEEAEEKATKKAEEEAEKVKTKAIEEAKAEAKIEAKEEIKQEAAEKKDDPLEIEIKKGEDQIVRYRGGSWDDSNPGEIQEPFLPDSVEMHPHNKECVEKVFERFPSRNHDECVLSEDQNTFVSINRIIDALVGAGCGTCAALIVAKQELKKYKVIL